MIRALLLLVSGVCLTIARGAELRAVVQRGAGDGVVDAVVSLVPLDGATPPVPAGAYVEVVQRAQEFLPFVTAVQVGMRVILPNTDTVQHHVYSLSRAKKFEFPLYNPGREEAVVFDAPGVVTLGCNIHDWMIAHVVVLPTPWFGKSDVQGKVTVTAPPGRYRLEVWHPRLASALVREVTLSDGATNAQSLIVSLKAERRVRRPVGSRPGGY